MMTALNCNIDSQIAKDGSLLALSDTQGGGISNGGNLAKMSDLANDTTMFRQGKPGSFLQVLTSAAGVDGKNGDGECRKYQKCSSKQKVINSGC